MPGNSLYSEKLFSKWIVIILLIPFTGMLLLSIATIASYCGQCFIICLHKKGLSFLVRFAPLFTLFFLLATINFSFIRIKIDSNKIKVSYGIIKYSIKPQNIEGCNIDKVPAYRYGGWGVRFSIYEGRKTLMFNIIGGNKVSILLKNRRFGRLVFSTNRPETVVKIINENFLKN